MHAATAAHAQSSNVHRMAIMHPSRPITELSELSPFFTIVSSSKNFVSLLDHSVRRQKHLFGNSQL
jgi:hypothetical protein